MRINSDLVRLKLAEQNMSLKELAQKTGLSPQSISTILNRGTCFPRNAGKIARSINIEESEIINPEC